MRSSLRALAACLLFSPIAIPVALAGEWETLRESHDSALRAYASRIAEIEARERGAGGDPGRRADKITRDRIAATESSLKSGGKGRSLAPAIERASGDSRALVDATREQGEYLDAVRSEWRADGGERRKLRESLVPLQKNLERANASLGRAIEVAETTTTRVPRSGVGEKVARIEAEARAQANWQREQTRLERERQQREREAAQRERGVR